jgi:hypothetical protein
MIETAPHRRHSEAGNVFFLIFLGIAMFAALSAVMIQSTRSNQGGLEREQSRMTGISIMDVAVRLERTVSGLRLRGCSENEIDFSTAPTGGDCQVFAESPALLDQLSAYDWLPSGSIAIDKRGTAAPELLLIVYGQREQVCRAINRSVGIDDIPTDSIPDPAGYFAGSYALTGTLDAPPLRGKSGGCAMVAGKPVFYHSLMTRSRPP